MTRPLVLLTNPIEPQERLRLAESCEVTELATPDAASMLAGARQAQAIIVRAPLPDDLFERCPGVLAAVRHGAGVDMIPVERASVAGVMVANAPGANAVTVAEYAISQMLQLSRRLARIDRNLREQDWPRARALADGGTDLAGRTLGVIGTGAIGGALGRMAGLGLSMTVLGHRRSPGALPEPMQRASLDELLASSDYVALTCPLTNETRGLIGAAQLARMKRGARLINVSRGAVVDQAALIEALGNGHLGGAALDVFETQPLPADSPLWNFDNVLLSPHMAGITVDSMRRMSRMVVDQVLEMLAGRPPRHFVNPQVWPTRRPNPFAVPAST
ncbi:MAG: hydroxyacid dehydrogenase [Burkholderiaceae bacterium]|nr:hydroxyacid dehydrogenase [Burkholderiaceae bacterium]